MDLDHIGDWISYIFSEHSNGESLSQLRARLLAQKEDKAHLDIENLPTKRLEAGTTIMELYEGELKRAIALAIVSR